jgi:predicted nuclease of predicted toxin-antitoxin system
VTHLRFIADMNISPLTVSDLKENGYVIITQDLDFSSIITLRLTVVDPEKVAEKLQNVYPKIIEQLQEGYAITIDDSSMRLRKLPI